MRYWMPLFAVLSLTGCKTHSEVMNSLDDEKCLSYGVAKGSPEYVQCRMNLDRSRAIENSAPVAMPVLDAPMRQPVTCTRTGNIATCN